MDAQIVGDARAKLGIESTPTPASGGRRRLRSGPPHRGAHGTARTRRRARRGDAVPARRRRSMRRAAPECRRRRRAGYRCGRRGIGGDGGACHRQRRCVHERCRCQPPNKACRVLVCALILAPPQRHTICRFLSGSCAPACRWRGNRVHTAGATTQIVGSPTPPQKSNEGTINVSTFGISASRRIS